MSRIFVFVRPWLSRSFDEIKDKKNLQIHDSFFVGYSTRHHSGTWHAKYINLRLPHDKNLASLECLSKNLYNKTSTKRLVSKQNSKNPSLKRNIQAVLNVAPFYPGLKSKGFRGRYYRREPKTEPGVISDENHTVDFSPAVLSHRNIYFCRLER